MKLEELEQARADYAAAVRKKTKIAFIIAAILFSPVVIAIIMTQVSIFDLIPLVIFPFFFLVFATIFINLTTTKQQQAYRRLYKAYFVTESLNKFFTQVQHFSDTGILKSEVRKAMTTGDRFRSNDLVIAKYKNINFTQADVHIEEEETDSDGNTSYSTIFRGRFLEFDFNRNFSFGLQVVQKGFAGAIRPTTGNNRKFSKIETESTVFNKQFKVYAEDGFEAFYILDPAFIEKIQNLELECKGKLLLTFLDSKLYIAINDHKDAFEAPSPMKPLDEKAELDKVGNDIKVITNFVDTLDLDKLFKVKK